jgi:hypothetical protein
MPAPRSPTGRVFGGVLTRIDYRHWERQCVNGLHLVD